MKLNEKVKRLREIRRLKTSKAKDQSLNRKRQTLSKRINLQKATDEQIDKYLKKIPVLTAGFKKLSDTKKWQNINWTLVYKTIFQQQCEIYKQVKNNVDPKKVRKLQTQLMRSPLNTILSVRKSTSDATGKKTAGVDYIADITHRERLAMAVTIKIDAETSDIKRVWIPKPGTKEKRPLGIPTIEDRVKQNMIKTALEPEWEAKLESGTYGFRPARKAADAIRGIWNSLRNAQKWVLDTDIEKCFDKIDHAYLLKKIGFPKTHIIHKQIKAWLEAGVVDKGNPYLARQDKGTPQGGVISPLLANIALSGIIEHTTQKVEEIYGKQAARKYMHIYVYADDLVVLANKKEHIQTAEEAIEEFLTKVGLNLKKAKTRIVNTLKAEESDDKSNKFEFLGMQFHQIVQKSKYKKHKINRDAKTAIFCRIIPKKKSVDKQFETIRQILKESTTPKQIVTRLSPVIRGWVNYASYSNARTSGQVGKWSKRLYIMLENWNKRTYGTRKRLTKTWTTEKGNRWRFYYQKSNGKKEILFTHDKGSYDISKYYPIKADKSPYDGDISYWMNRIPKYAGSSALHHKILRRQKFKCGICEENFLVTEPQIYQIDHKKRKASGGGNQITNLQALHTWCHENKTALENSKLEINTKLGKKKAEKRHWVAVWWETIKHGFGGEDRWG